MLDTMGKCHAKCFTSCSITRSSFPSFYTPGLDMDWIHPWIGLDWIGLDWV